MNKKLRLVTMMLLCTVAFASCKKDTVKEANVSEQSIMPEEPFETEECISESEGTVSQEEAENAEDLSKAGAAESDTNDSQIMLGTSGYSKLEDAAESADSVINEKHDNLLFREDFDVEVPEELGAYQLVREETFNQDGESLPKYFLGDKFESKFLKRPDGANSEDYTYEDTKNSLDVYTSAYGYCFYKTDSSDELDYMENGTPIFMYSNYDNKTSYPVEGGKMTIPEVLEAGQDFADKYTAKYGDLTWQPYVIYMKQEKDENYGFYIFYTVGYNGVSFCPMQDDIYSEQLESVIGIEMGSNVLYNSIYIDSTSGISGFRNQFGLLKYKKTEQTFNQIVSFECAEKIVEDNIKDGSCHNIVDVRLEYWLVAEEHDELVNDNFSLNNSGTAFKTKPYWVFYTGDSQSVVPEACITVDCITGKCYQTGSNGDFFLYSREE